MVTWEPSPWLKPKDRTPAQRTPNLAELVQEIVDREGWTENNAIAFIITGTGERVAESRDGSLKAAGNDSRAAVLQVTYQVADGEPVTAAFALGTTEVNGDSTDDAEEFVISQFVDPGSTDLEMTFDTTGGETHEQLIGLRYPNLTIPAGATILASHIQFTVDQTTNISKVTKNLEHAVVLSGLDANTTYYYSIGYGSCAEFTLLAGGDQVHYVTTAPAPDSYRPFTVWFLGDSGEGGKEAVSPNSGRGNGARRVRDAFLKWNEGSPDLCVLLGDNAYRDGKEIEYQYGFFNIFPTVLRNTPVWPTLGNHEFASDFIVNSTLQSGPYYDLFSLPRFGEAGGIPSGTEAYYSFDYETVHFVSLESFFGISRGPESFIEDMKAWLEADIIDSAQNPNHKWRIAFFHHPPYSKGSHATDGLKIYRKDSSSGLGF